jgi:hypothetical protein
MHRRRLISILAIASSIGAPLLATSPAHAQGWLSDRRYTEGIGIKAGDFEIHPGIGGEAGFDSNWFQRTYNPGFVNSNEVPAGVFRLTGSLYLATLGPQRKEGDVNAAPPTVNFRLGAAVTQRFFVGDQDVVNQNGIDGLSADLSGRLDVLPQRPFSFGLQAGYNRVINPNTTGNPDANFNRNTLNVGADFTLRPGSGTLDWKFGYNGNFAFFDSSQAPFNNLQNSIFTRGSWKFTPKTAVIYDANFSFIDYTQQTTAFNGLQNSTPLRSRLGMNGLIGSRFALSAFAGYGGSFIQTNGNTQIQQYGFGYADKSFPGIIGQLEGKFFLTANPATEQNPGNVTLSVSALSLGYNRDFAQSYLGSFYGSDRGYLKFSFFFGGRALVSLEGGVGAREYPRVFANGGGGTLTAIHDPFTDVAVDATIFGEYRFTNTLGLNTTLKYTEEVSSTSLPSDANGDLYHMAFRRFEAYLGFRWFM